MSTHTACRDPKKAAAAVASLEQIIPNSSTVSFLPLDLSIKQSVESFVKSFPYPRIDLLLCNAGCVNASLTHAWGNLEATFAANHLGHFALVMLLIKRGVLPGNGSSRVVVVSSGIHVPGRSPTGGPKFDFDNLKNSVEPYDSMVAYANSKLANVWFSYELARWVKEKGK
ncbi:Short-chain dehydrogenase/reductase 2b [Borealophlyctis nickersoniae]|nr:Short-chain dehydrogenase/reductase 2b [Borealophlyctis nickersoniae]